MKTLLISAAMASALLFVGQNTSFAEEGETPAKEGAKVADTDKPEVGDDAEKAVEDPNAHTRSTYDAYMELNAKQSAISAKWSPKLRELSALEDKTDYNAARTEYLKELNAVRPLVAAARATFGEAFKSADLTHFDKSEERSLLLAGLYYNATGELESDPLAAMNYAKTLLDWYPDAGEVRTCVTYVLPVALLAAGDLEGAEEELTELIDAHEAYAGDTMMNLGDLLAMQGRFEEAQELYAQALETKTAANPKDRTINYLNMRIELIGKTAPNIESDSWLGGEAKSLADLQGNVVMIDFWATWCGPCIGSMPGLIKMYDELKLQGVEFLGVTRFYANGYLAASREELEKGERNGESVRDMDEESFMQHLKDFRRNVDVNYPFVVGEAGDFSKYKVTGIPSMFVVNHEGVVTCAIVGGGRKAVLKAAIHAAIEAKDAAAAKTNAD